jgi:hypothetical protein
MEPLGETRRIGERIDARFHFGQQFAGADDAVGARHVCLVSAARSNVSSGSSASFSHLRAWSSEMPTSRN